MQHKHKHTLSSDAGYTGPGPGCHGLVGEQNLMMMNQLELSLRSRSPTRSRVPYRTELLRRAPKGRPATRNPRFFKLNITYPDRATRNPSRDLSFWNLTICSMRLNIFQVIQHNRFSPRDPMPRRPPSPRRAGLYDSESSDGSWKTKPGASSVSLVYTQVRAQL